MEPASGVSRSAGVPQRDRTTPAHAIVNATRARQARKRMTFERLRDMVEVGESKRHETPQRGQSSATQQTAPDEGAVRSCQ